MDPKEAKAIQELSSAISDLNDYNELPNCLQETISKYIPVDWLALFSAPAIGGIYNVTSNPHLPFNWDELYQEIAPYDYFRERSLAAPVCQPIIHADIYNPHDEIESYCYNFAKKHTGTVHLLGMSTVNDSDGIALLGLYRTEEKFGFSQKDKVFYQQLGPLLRSTSKQLMLYQQWDLKRQSYDKLFETAEIRPVFMDHKLCIIDLPLPTLSFLRNIFDNPFLEGLPSIILNAIDQHVAPEGEVVLGTGPWNFRVNAVHGDIICHAHVMATEQKRPVLIIRFEQHGVSDDFSQLATIGFTRREIETISYLPLGYTNKQIAMAMSIGEDGVKQHLKRLSKKLGASGRTEILFQALEMKKSIQLYGELPKI